MLVALFTFLYGRDEKRLTSNPLNEHQVFFQKPAVPSYDFLACNLESSPSIESETTESAISP